MDQEIYLTGPEYALYQKVKKKPRKTYVAYKEPNRRRLDKLVRAGVLWIVRGKRWAMPARYSIVPNAKFSVSQ